MTTLDTRASDKAAVLSKALLNAGKALGMSQTQLGLVIGKDRTSIKRGIEPDSKAGELALLLLRCYQSLFILVGGKHDDMKHWMHTANRHTRGTPVEQVQSIIGLTQVVDYLDALCGKA